MGATNKQIYDEVLHLTSIVSAMGQSVIDVVQRLDRQNGSITSHAQAIAAAQGDIAVLKTQAKADANVHKTTSTRTWSVILLLVGVALAVLQAMIIDSLTELRSEDSADRQALAVCEALPTPAPTLAATVQPTATRTPIVAPMTMIRRATDDEITYLAALCYVEVRGMGDKTASACASVIDTVYKRIALRKFSDGTVAGTLTFDCKAGDSECHFPAYTVNGCARFANCPYDNPEQLRLFKSIVSAYISGALMPTCSGYLYYGMKPFDDNECTIVDVDSGQFINFHN